MYNILYLNLKMVARHDTTGFTNDVSKPHLTIVYVVLKLSEKYLIYYTNILLQILNIIVSGGL